MSLKLKLPDWKDPKTRLKLIFYGGALLVFILLSAAAGFCFTSTNSFCNMFCHSMDEDVASLSRSTHAELNCRACHGPGELIPFLIYELTASPKEALAQITGNYHKPINKESHAAQHDELLSENCLRCHAITKREVTPSPGVIIDHKKHEEKEIGCAYCHNRVAHPISGYEDFTAMGGCYRENCHSLAAGARAPGKCEACHPKGFELMPKNHKAADFLPPKHAKMAKEDIKYCDMCHMKKFCEDCHGMEMPHPAKFVKTEHGTTGRQNPASCNKCHPQKQFCTACHHKGYDENAGPFTSPDGTGRPVQHPIIVKAKGAESCFKCHGPTYCSHCHIQGKKAASIKGP